MNKNKDYNECCGAIPSKTSYIDMFGNGKNSGKTNTKTNEIYYFGTPPKKPGTLSNYLKGKKK